MDGRWPRHLLCRPRSLRLRGSRRRRNRCSTRRCSLPVLLGLTLLAASMPRPTQALQPETAPKASRGEIWDP